MKRIAVFLGDFFWSSIPYDGLRLLSLIQNHYNADLLMFDNDIRLNKKFNGNEKFNFDTNVFKNFKNLKTIKNWNELYNVSKDYDLIITSSHIAPKTRFPQDIKNKVKCRFAVWDIGGADILTNPLSFSNIFFVKSKIWKNWLIDRNIASEDIFVTGSPHYDDYILKVYDDQEKTNFYSKYNIKKELKTMLVCPSNPTSRKIHFEENLKELEKLIIFAEKKGVQLLLKTYPNDYVFYEEEKQFSGVYRRPFTETPQYEYLNNRYPVLKVIESQDHHKAVMFSCSLFNMSGSHIAWETHFSKTKCFSINYKDKHYYTTVSYLPGVIFPDNIYNTNIKNITEVTFNDKVHHEDNDYMITVDSCDTISKRILDVDTKK